ncbi:MAG: hypothetical protein K2H82_09670, partial [Oscillospiraceae bacterium]|nr:hypothetical protein [Oscillospiraceae bacterium]
MMNEIFLGTAEYKRPATGESWVRSATTLKSDRKLTPTARDIYDVLLDMCTEANNIIRISLNSLKRKAFCCRKSVTNALNRLEKCGYINKLPKAWETETNTFFVFKILPDKKRRSSAKAAEQFENNLEIQMPETLEIRRTKPEKVKKSQKKKPEQSNKKRYGKYSLVALTDKEYNELMKDFGQATVQKYIQIADDYSKKYNKKYPYPNNAEFIRNMIETDRKLGTLPKNYNPWRTKSYNYHSKNNTMPKEELESYLRLGMRFEEPTEEELKKINDEIAKLPEIKPEAAPLSEPIPESEPWIPVTAKYEMTEEEVDQILNNWNYDIILKNPLHPLYNLVPGELYDLAMKAK